MTEAGDDHQPLPLHWQKTQGVRRGSKDRRGGRRASKEGPALLARLTRRLSVLASAADSPAFCPC
jgi:hypothetical protein